MKNPSEAMNDRASKVGLKALHWQKKVSCVCMCGVCDTVSVLMFCMNLYCRCVCVRVRSCENKYNFYLHLCVIAAMTSYASSAWQSARYRADEERIHKGTEAKRNEKTQADSHFETPTLVSTAYTCADHKR